MTNKNSNFAISTILNLSDYMFNLVYNLEISHIPYIEKIIKLETQKYLNSYLNMDFELESLGFNAINQYEIFLDKCFKEKYPACNYDQKEKYDLAYMFVRSNMDYVNIRNYLENLQLAN